MKKPVAALTSFMASAEDAAPLKLAVVRQEEPVATEIPAAPKALAEPKALPPPKSAAGRKPLPVANDAQLILRVPEAMEREFKIYAAQHGKKLNHLFIELFKERLERERRKEQR